ncbi:MAG TPA: hypothetical protein VFN08_11220 [Gemmatimonadales bacterium]|nr:hypothetical protein [Gemmatimonadales bacterium]
MAFGVLELLPDPGKLGLETVKLDQEGVGAPRLDLAPALALVDEQSELPRRAVALPANPHQLDLQLALVQRRLRLFPESFELLVEPIE